MGSTASASTSNLRTRQRKKKATRMKLQTLAKKSSAGSVYGSAMAEKRRNSRLNPKPMISCSAEPGRMSAANPTRNSFLAISATSHQ